MYFAPRPSPAALDEVYRSGRYRDEERREGGPDARATAHRYAMFAQALSRLGHPGPGGRLLDVGCGTGAFLEAALGAGWDVSGTELSRDAASQPAARSRCTVHAGDLPALNLPAGQYSMITMFHVAEHLLAPVAHFAEARRLLAPRGGLFVETPNLGGAGARLRGGKWSMIIPPEHVNYFDEQSLAAALRLAGFKAVRTWSISPHVAGSIAALPAPLRALGELAYRVAPALGFGPLLQAYATEGDLP